jgi:DNA-binding XRE family transcriptional regulator
LEAKSSDWKPYLTTRRAATARKAALDYADKAGAQGKLDAAKRSQELAQELGASDRQLTKSEKEFGKNAVKTAKAAAAKGDNDVTTAATAHARGTLGVKPKTLDKIENESVLNNMKNLIRDAALADKRGQKDVAVEALTDLKKWRDQGRFDLLPADTRRQAVELSALYNKEVAAAYAERYPDAPPPQPRPAHVARNGVVGTIKDNLYMSYDLADHLDAAEALLKKGRAGEAVDALETAPEPRGWYERKDLKRVLKAVRKVASGEVEAAAKAGKVDEARASLAALARLDAKSKDGKPYLKSGAAAKARRAALDYAKRAGKAGELSKAKSSIELAREMGASEREITSSQSTLGQNATTVAKAAAKLGDTDKTLDALDYARAAPDAKPKKLDAIESEAVLKRMKTLIKTAEVAHRGADKPRAVTALTELKKWRDQGRFDLLSTSDRRDAVQLSALYKNDIELAVAANDSPSAASSEDTSPAAGVHDGAPI